MGELKSFQGGTMSKQGIIFLLLIVSFSAFADELPIPPRLIVPKHLKDLTITLSQFKAKISDDLAPVSEWGYNGSSPGPTIEVEKGQRIRIHWKNELPTTHLFPEPANVSMGGMPGMPGMGSLPDVRSVTHLHGAVVTESPVYCILLGW